MGLGFGVKGLRFRVQGYPKQDLGVENRMEKDMGKKKDHGMMGSQGLGT